MSEDYDVPPDAIIVCVSKKEAPHPILADNVTGICFHCRTEVWARPFWPKSAKMICLECIVNELAKAKGK